MDVQDLIVNTKLYAIPNFITYNGHAHLGSELKMSCRVRTLRVFTENSIGWGRLIVWCYKWSIRETLLPNSPTMSTVRILIYHAVCDLGTILKSIHESW